jgi:DNA-binding LytR/AlgR family response regulator
MTCIIVDDEAAAIEILEGYTQKKTTLKHLASFTNPIEALSYVQNHSVDLIFLDINMPHLSGLGFLELLKGRSKVILTTAYSEYALDGYKYDVVDYLTKPISFENFLRAVQKAEDRNTPSSSASKSTDKNALDDFIMVKSDHKGKLVKVVFSDILYIESMKNYVATLLSMKELEERLPKEHFFRTHKTYIVALNQIKMIDGGEIILQDAKDRVPLGITYREAFFTMLEGNMM